MEKKLIVIFITTLLSLNCIVNVKSQPENTEMIIRDESNEKLRSAFYESNRAIENLSSIYKYIQLYRLDNDGEWPEGMLDLKYLVVKDLGLFGDDTTDSNKIFLNPDARLSKNKVFARAEIPPYFIRNRRIDGSEFDSPKQFGSNDVLCFTDIYYVNSYSSRTGKTVNTQGGFVVLKDNGSIEKVPFDDVFFSSTNNGESFKPIFPQQAKMTPKDCLSYQEFFDVILKKGNIVGKPITEEMGFLVLDNGGPESLYQLSKKVSAKLPDFNRNSLWHEFDPSQQEFTITEVQHGATELGLNTQATKQTLAQLQKSGTPALLFLQDDGRIVTLTALDDDRAVIIDRGLTQNVERSVLEKRYGGEALVPTKALTQNAAIVADDAVREVKLPSLDAEVPQQFVLRNTGATPITLQLEYPMLGVTESKLSKDVIAPGETATLDLKVKWRSILKAPYQNVLVSIQTNDPIVPRLQLAILLTPPIGAGK